MSTRSERDRWDAREVRIAFSGAGMVSELHAAAIAESPKARLIGVFDPDVTLVARRSAEWGCQGYESYDQLLADDDVDAVFVLSPTRQHVEQSIAAIESGKHVLVEKPVGASLDEVSRLIEVAGASEKICLPGHNYAYVPEFRRIRRLTHQGALGELRLVAAIFVIAHDELVASHYDGVMRLIMPHHAYLVHGLLGMPRSVTAGLTEPAWKSLNRHDQAWIALDYPPHGTALLFATLGVDDNSTDPWSFVVKAVGTRGSASGTWRSSVFERSIGSMSTGFGPYEEAYEYQLAAFVAALHGDDGSVQSPLSDAVAVERILEAAERSIVDRRTIDL